MNRRDEDTVIVGERMMGLPGHDANVGYYGEFGTLVWQPQIYVNNTGSQYGMEGTFYSN